MKGIIMKDKVYRSSKGYQEYSNPVIIKGKEIQHGENVHIIKEKGKGKRKEGKSYKGGWEGEKRGEKKEGGEGRERK